MSHPQQHTVIIIIKGLNYYVLSILNYIDVTRLHYQQNVKTVIVNNSFNINKTDEQLPLNANHWTYAGVIQVLNFKRHKNMTGLNRLLRSKPSLLNHLTSNVYTDINKQPWLCDSMSSFWVEANLGRFLWFVYMCIIIDDPLIKREVLGPINNPPNFGGCLKS